MCEGGKYIIFSGVTLYLPTKSSEPPFLPPCVAALFQVQSLHMTSKVVHDQSGKDFLIYVLHLFCVKMLEADGVFQLAERSFNSPAHPIQLFDSNRQIISV